MYGSGARKVAASVNEALLEQAIKTGTEYVACTKEDAEGYIDKYFASFPQLRKWIESSHSMIENNGFIYSPFGRKRRLTNINSDDKGVRSGELRSGFNAVIQGTSSDSLLLGAIDADKEIESLGLEYEMKIIMLVHDSVVSIVREDLVDQYNEILVRNIEKDRGVSIPGYPIGVGQDSADGGSWDYSCGKVDSQHPLIASIGNEEYVNKLKGEIFKSTSVQYVRNALKEKDIANTTKEEFPLLTKVFKDCNDPELEINTFISKYAPTESLKAL